MGRLLQRTFRNWLHPSTLGDGSRRQGRLQGPHEQHGEERQILLHGAWIAWSLPAGAGRCHWGLVGTNGGWHQPLLVLPWLGLAPTWGWGCGRDYPGAGVPSSIPGPIKADTLVHEDSIDIVSRFQNAFK